MANEFNIKKVISDAHGYVGLPFPALGFDNFKRLPDLETIGKSVLGKNHLGRPYFMDVIIDGLRLPNEPLVTFSKQKKIVETVLAGTERKGTVKELIQSGDYRIKIQGVCLNNGAKEYPQKQVEDLVNLCEKNEALAIENALAEIFKVKKLVITGYGFPDMKGRPHSQAYYINAVSDEDFYATIKQNKNISNL